MTTKTEKSQRKRQGRAEATSVLVTGASGRLGRRLCAELLESGIEVRGLVSRHEQMNLLVPGTVPFVADIVDESALRKACEGIDHVYHFAAIVSQKSKSPAEIIRVNSRGTLSVLSAMESEKVHKLIFPSSVDVYGIKRKEVLTEESSVHPTDMYGHSKMIAERQIENFGKSIDYTIFRTAAIYGPGFESSFFKVFKMIKDGKLYIVGNGENNMALVHINDVIKAMALAAEKPASGIYNLSDGKAYTQNKLVSMAARLLNVPVPSKHVSAIMAKMFAGAAGINADEMRFITANRIIDITRIKKELGFIPRAIMEKSAAELVDMFMLKYNSVKNGAIS